MHPRRTAYGDFDILDVLKLGEQSIMTGGRATCFRRDERFQVREVVGVNPFRPPDFTLSVAEASETM